MNRHQQILATLCIGVSLLALAVMLFVSLGSKDPSQEDLIAAGKLPAGAVFCLGNHKFVHSGGCDVISWSPDGQYLACRGLFVTGTVDEFLDVWERTTGRYVVPAELRRREISGFAWGPKPGEFVTSEYNAPTEREPFSDKKRGRICLWTIGKDEPVRVIDDKQGYSSVNWSPDGNFIVARTTDESVLVNEVRLFGVDGRRLGEWNFEGEEAVNHGSPVFEFTRDSENLLQVSKDGVRLHDLPSGNVLSHAKFKTDKIFAIRALSNDKFGVAAASGARIFQILPGELKAAGHAEEFALDLSASPDGKWLAIAGSSHKSICVTVRDLATLPAEPTHLWKTMLGGAAFAPQSGELVLPNRRLRFVDSANWEPVRFEDEHAASVVVGAITGSQLWTRDTEGRITEWNLKTGRRVQSCLQNPMLPFGSRLCGNKIVQIDDTEITISQADAQAVACTLPTPNSAWGVVGIFSPSLNRVYATDKAGFLRSWSVADGSLVFKQPLTQHVVSGYIPSFRLTLSADGQFMASVGGYPLRVTVLDPTTGKEHWQAPLELDAFPCPCAFSANSKLLAYPYAFKDKEDNLHYHIQVCDCRTGQSAATIPCTLGSIDRLALLPDGKLVAAVGKDAFDRMVIQLWSVGSKKLVHEFRGHLERCSFLEFTADGSRLVSASQDTTALVWDTSKLKR